ncbi:hypothetical protein DMA12_37445 [Amycolatopsis balhimycina DSM 5908]|uniref:Uncharacterized protein n=1 Tax=Amycolatopsis balhimycina DSM 5908 TaxID=1081091 RepID=A0A428W2G4_AMYBA|nr:hypothetical protein DMA12_37445 [Amycolatopsis balhimycina DSM 5908]
MPIARFVARSELAVIALQHVVAYPAGCSLTLHLAVRRGSWDDSTWAGIDMVLAGGLPGPADASLQFRVDRGSLVELGGGASSNDRSYRGERQLWLAPLPSEAFEFAVEWRKVGIERTTIRLDGRVIAEAAKGAEPFWP